MGSSRYTKGFTLIELLVVIGIMAIVSSILLVNQSKFDSSTLLRSLTYSVALSVRQAQVYGSSVLGTTTASTNCVGGSYTSGTCYAASYGVYFSSGSLTSYILFADLNNNGAYDPGEAIQTFSLGNGYTISDFGATTTAGILRSYQNGALTSLSITFKRPNPDALFTTNLSPGDTYGSAAYIQISNTGGTSLSTRSVTVSSTGEISVGNAGT